LEKRHRNRADTLTEENKMKTVKNNNIQRVAKLMVLGAIAPIAMSAMAPTANAQIIIRDPDSRRTDTVTHTGTVTRDLSGGYFELRTDSNRTVRVYADRGRLPRGFNRGDRVRATGENRRGLFHATTIQLLGGRDDRRDDRRGSQSEFTGVINRNLVGDKFELRADDGRHHILKVSREDSRRLERGDRVRVTGRPSSTGIEVSHLQILGRGSDSSAVTTINGTVTRTLVGDTFEIRADGGRTLWVRLDRGRLPRGFERGSRVRVKGTYTSSRNTIVAREVELLSDRVR
jgi:translation initiation factor IF-1